MAGNHDAVRREVHVRFDRPVVVLSINAILVVDEGLEPFWGQRNRTCKSYEPQSWEAHHKENIDFAELIESEPFSWLGNFEVELRTALLRVNSFSTDSGEVGVSS